MERRWVKESKREVGQEQIDEDRLWLESGSWKRGFSILKVINDAPHGVSKLDMRLKASEVANKAKTCLLGYGKLRSRTAIKVRVSR